MGRLIGSWLSGPQATLKRVQDAQRGDDWPRWRGEHLGLPESGPGSAAPVSRRALAFVIDILLAALVASLFTGGVPGDWSLVAWAVIATFPVSFAGFTPGMMLTKIQVARLDGELMVGPWRAMLRCLLTFLIIPAVVWDRDGRSWHDRMTKTAVVRR